MAFRRQLGYIPAAASRMARTRDAFVFGGCGKPGIDILLLGHRHRRHDPAGSPMRHCNSGLSPSHIPHRNSVHRQVLLPHRTRMGFFVCSRYLANKVDRTRFGISTYTHTIRVSIVPRPGTLLHVTWSRDSSIGGCYMLSTLRNFSPQGPFSGRPAAAEAILSWEGMMATKPHAHGLVRISSGMHPNVAVHEKWGFRALISISAGSVY